MKQGNDVLIGLGNPGKKYEGTYHNVGQLFLDYLKNKNSEGTRKKTLPSANNWQIQKKFAYFKKDAIILVKSLVFMNQSGSAVKAALRYFKIKPQNILIIHDDSDIELGKYKISFDRSSAGHQGVQSIIDSLGTKKFWRLRIGIRPPKNHQPRKKAAELVLRKINYKNMAIIEKIFEDIKKFLNL